MHSEVATWSELALFQLEYQGENNERETFWRREGQPIPVLLTEKSHGQRSLVTYTPMDGKESDRTKHAGMRGRHVP